MNGGWNIHNWIFQLSIGENYWSLAIGKFGSLKNGTGFHDVFHVPFFTLHIPSSHKDRIKIHGVCFPRNQQGVWLFSFLSTLLGKDELQHIPLKGKLGKSSNHMEAISIQVAIVQSSWHTIHNTCQCYSVSYLQVSQQTWKTLPYTSTNASGVNVFSIFLNRWQIACLSRSVGTRKDQNTASTWPKL